MAKQKVFKVELKQRITLPDTDGTILWATNWQDITSYFIKRTSDVSTDLDDTTFGGKLEQTAVSLELDNLNNEFGTEGISFDKYELQKTNISLVYKSEPIPLLEGQALRYRRLDNVCRDLYTS